MSPVVLVTAALLIVGALLYHAIKTRGKKWASWFFFSALAFGLWHEIVPLRLSDPEYYFTGAVKLFHLPVVGVIGWGIVFYLSFFLLEIMFPKLLRGRILIVPVLVLAFFAGMFSLCIETTGIGLGWWVWRADRQHMIFPVLGWASQCILFFSVFFSLFHSDLRTKIVLLVALIFAAPTIGESELPPFLITFLQAATTFSFVGFARIVPHSFLRNIDYRLKTK